MTSTESLLTELEQLDWTPRFEATSEAVQHLQRYLEAQRAWGRQLDCMDEWPVIDIAAHLGAPNLPKPVERRLDAVVDANWLRGFAARACHAMLRATLVELPKGSTPTPWPSLLQAFRLAGSIRQEHNFLQVGLASVPLRA